MSVLNAFIAKVVTQIVNPLILLLETGAFLVFLWGLFQFIREADDADKREEGRRAIFWGLVGFVVIFGAYGIINIALSTFGLDQLNPGQFSNGG